MAGKIKITEYGKTYTHFTGLSSDYTLCGLSGETDETCCIIVLNKSSKKVNCPKCIAIINHCKSIDKSEYKTN